MTEILQTITYIRNIHMYDELPRKSDRMALQNEHFLTALGVDTTRNEPAKLEIKVPLSFCMWSFWNLVQVTYIIPISYDCMLI